MDSDVQLFLSISMFIALDGASELFYKDFYEKIDIQYFLWIFFYIVKNKGVKMILSSKKLPLFR